MSVACLPYFFAASQRDTWRGPCSPHSGRDGATPSHTDARVHHYNNERMNYRFTFIDATDSEEAAQGVQLRRALTPPPVRPGCLSHLGEDALSEEVESARCRDYLKGLMDERGLVTSNRESNRMPSGSKKANDTVSDAPKVSSEAVHVGRLGHPIACRRPCVHMMARRQCQNGSACGFCHFPHPREAG